MHCFCTKRAAIGVIALVACLSSFRGVSAGERAMMPAGRSASPAAAYRVYVTNEFSGDVSVIDPLQTAVVATWRLGKRPRGIVVSPDGQRLYVALSGSPLAPPGIDESQLPPADKAADGIGVVDTRSGALVNVIRGISDPEQLAISADGQRLYVASEDTGLAMVVDVVQGAVIASAPVGGEPEGVGVSPDGTAVFITSETAGTIARLDSGSIQVTGRVSVGLRPRDIAFSPIGTLAYVPGELDASLTIVDWRRMKVLGSVKVPGEAARPKGVVTAGDGTVYVTTGRGGAIIYFGGDPLTARKSVAVGGRPWGIGLSPDDKLLFTANGAADDVAVVDRATLTVIAHVPVGRRPWGVAIGRYDVPPCQD